MSKEELQKKIAKGHNLRGCVNYPKSQLINRLRGEGLLPEGVNEHDKDKDRYKFINRIRYSSKRVRVNNLARSKYVSLYLRLC